MNIRINNGKLIIDEPIATGTDAPISKQGRSRIALSTKGWKFIDDEATGKTYRISLNLITSLSEKGN